jgi:hypothetical protein
MTAWVSSDDQSPEPAPFALSAGSKAFENKYFGSSRLEQFTESGQHVGDGLQTDPGQNNVVKASAREPAQRWLRGSPSSPSSSSEASLLAPPYQAGDDHLCVVCMERPAGLQLLPCRHDRFCCRCIVETIGAQTRPAAPPPCPLCRSAFHALAITRPA